MLTKKNIINPLKIGFTSFLFVLSNYAFATTYYIDAINGSDNNSGTSEAQAWKTVGKVNSVQSNFIEGDVIAFKKNQTFNGSLSLSGLNGSSGNPITVTSFGTGEKPILSTLTTVQWSDWTQVTTNIYKRNSSYIRRLGENGAEILKARNINFSTFARETGVTDPLDAQFKWHYNSNTLYLYSTTNPNNNTFTYSTSGSTIAISDASYIVVDGIHIKGGNAGIYIADSSYITIQNCNMGEYSLYGIQLNKGSGIRTNNNITISGNIVDSKFEAFDYGNSETYSGSSDKGPSDGIEIEDAIDSLIMQNYVKNWCHTSLQMISYGGTVENNEVNNNTFTAPNLPYGGRIAVDYANYNEFHHNLLTDSAVSTQLNGHGNYYHHNYIDGTRDTPLKSGNQGLGAEFFRYGVLDVHDNRFEYNTVINCQGSGISFTATGVSGKRVYNMQIKNNILHNNGSLPYYSSGSAVNIELMIQHYVDIEGQTFTDNAISNDKTTDVINFLGKSMTVEEFNTYNGTEGHIISGNVNLYPPESSTTYGAGPRENVGAGSLVVSSQPAPKTGAFILDRSGLH